MDHITIAMIFLLSTNSVSLPSGMILSEETPQSTRSQGPLIRYGVSIWHHPRFPSVVHTWEFCFCTGEWLSSVWCYNEAPLFSFARCPGQKSGSQSLFACPKKKLCCLDFTNFRVYILLPLPEERSSWFWLFLRFQRDHGGCLTRVAVYNRGLPSLYVDYIVLSLTFWGGSDIVNWEDRVNVLGACAKK